LLAAAGGVSGRAALADRLMTPSIAALLGRWFWWPVRMRQRPVPQNFGDENTRQLSLFSSDRLRHRQLELFAGPLAVLAASASVDAPRQR
jgi:uncharacterized membrane protein YdfJ with MMPL/SSD domain